MSTDADPGSAGEDADHENARQNVVTVDADGNEEGLANRLDAHTGDGIRHRAFTCLVFDGDDHVLLGRRAPDKRLWDTHWDRVKRRRPASVWKRNSASPPTSTPISASRTGSSTSATISKRG